MRMCPRDGEAYQALGRRVQCLHVNEWVNKETSNEARQVSPPKPFNARTDPQSLPAAWAREASPAWRLPHPQGPAGLGRAKPTHSHQ